MESVRQKGVKDRRMKDNPDIQRQYGVRKDRYLCQGATGATLGVGITGCLWGGIQVRLESPYPYREGGAHRACSGRAGGRASPWVDRRGGPEKGRLALPVRTGKQVLTPVAVAPPGPEVAEHWRRSKSLSWVRSCCRPMA